MSANETGHITVLKDPVGYPMWLKEISNLLSSKDLMKYADGSHPLTAVDAANPAAVKLWRTEDATAQNYLFTTLHETVKVHLLTTTNAQQVFTAIKQIFERDSEQQKCQLLREFYAKKWDKTKNVLQNVSEIRNLMFRLTSLGMPICDTMVITKILEILPGEYRYFSAAWESQAARDRTLENLVSRLQNEEAKVSPSTSSTDNPVCFKAETRRTRSVSCFKCGELGHVQKFCRSGRRQYGKGVPNNNFRDRRSRHPLCGYCKNVRHWHLEKDCLFKKRASAHQGGQKRDHNNEPKQQPPQKKPRFAPRSKPDPSGDKPTNVSTFHSPQSDCSKQGTYAKQTPVHGGQGKQTLRSVGQNCMLLDNTEAMDINVQGDFCADSGCTAHMTHDRSLLSNMRTVEQPINVAKKDQSMQSHGMGHVIGQKYTLNDTLFVPELRRNLLSVHKITEENKQVLFSKSGVKILDADVRVPEETVILEGHKTKQGLFIVDMQPVRTYNMVRDPEEAMSAQLWHRKLGHLSMHGLKKLSELREDIKVKVTSEDLVWKCGPCIQAKQKKNPHIKIRDRASAPLRVIHSDVCGPFPVPTYDKKLYYVLFVDDFTHFCTVFIIQHKNEVFPLFQQYVAQAENFHCKKVFMLRCDNGGEYKSKACIEWCKSKGIVMDCSTPGCPQLNGTSERMNRTIQERARALLFDSGLPNSFWGEAVQTAVYLINRSPSSTVTSTPAALWYGKEQSLEYLQLFGAEAYAKVLSHVSKLDHRSVKSILVGYGSNGYRLWDPENRKIFMSHDVVFTGQMAQGPRTQEETVDIFTSQPFRELPEPVGKSKEIEELNSPRGPDAENNLDNVIESPAILEEICNQEESASPVLGEPELQNIPLPSTAGERQENMIQENPIQEQGRRLRPRDSLRIPSRFQDFEMNLNTESSSGVEAFLTFVEEAEHEVMLSYEECMKDKKWRKAINEEKCALHKNNVWTLVDKERAQGRDIVTSRWIFKTKEDGIHKARLVARGFQQSKTSFDFKDLYSPVVDTATLRTLLSLAAQQKFRIVTFDVKTAFLNGTLDREVFMQVPEGFNGKGKICLLKKALYGLNQAPLRWYKRLTSFLLKEGLHNIKTDKCIFRNQDKSLYLAIHVDDGIVLSSDNVVLGNLLKKLKEEFEVKINYRPDTYVGFQFEHNPDGLLIHQTKYTLSVLEKYGMSTCNPLATPMEAETTNQPATFTEKDFPYRQLVGSLLYLSCKTRPDIAYAVNVASRKVNNPSDEDIVQAKHILKYLRGSVSFGLQYYSANTLENRVLQTYSDSDFASSGPEEKMKSTSGYTILFGGGPITWCSRKQSIVATSSAEAEYIAAAECCKELQFLSTLLTELTDKQPVSIFHIDNQGAIALIKSGKMNWKSKHFNIRYYFISEKLDERLFTLQHCPSADQVADILTKPLRSVKFKKFRDMLCVDTNPAYCFLTCLC